MRQTVKHTHARLLASMLFLTLLFAGPVAAQGDGPRRVYEAPDGSFAFEYPAAWALQTTRGMVFISGDGLTISVVGPDRLESAARAGFGEPQAVLTALGRKVGMVGSPVPLVLNERPAARLDALNEAGYPGFLLVATLRDGRLAAVDVRYTDALRAPDETAALALIASLDVPVGLPPERLSAPLDSPPIIVAELVAAGVIPSGVAPIFDVDRTFREGRDDALFMSLAGNAPAQDIVMGGTLILAAGDAAALETCSLGARIVSDRASIITEYLEVGFSSAGRFFYGDHAAAGIQSGISARQVSGSTHQVTLVALGGELTVYLDGERIFDRVPVTARAGIYGVGVISGESWMRCEGRDVWAYAIPAVGRGVCLAKTAARVNRRTGPGLDYSSSAYLLPGEIAQVLARSSDSQGSTWWLLADGTYVSGTVVGVEGYCVGLPFRR
jgi:hypothetical protein